MVCCSRPTFVICVGVLHSITNLIVAIGCTIGLVNFDDLNLNVDPDKKRILYNVMWIVLSMCLFTVALSVTMVVGVVMKRYKLIAPYLWLSICGTVVFVFTNLLLTCWLMFYGASIGTVILALIRIALITGLQFLILRPIYMLHKEWRAEAQGVSVSKQATCPSAPPAYQTLYGNEKTPIDL